MSNHTPEPWQFQKGFNNIFESNSGITTAITKMSDHQVNGGHAEAEANGLRAVACVNACAGMADPEQELTEMRRQLAAMPVMLEALNKLCDAYKELCLMSGYNFHQVSGSRYTAARAAMALAEGK